MKNSYRYGQGKYGRYYGYYTMIHHKLTYEYIFRAIDYAEESPAQQGFWQRLVGK